MTIESMEKRVEQSEAVWGRAEMFCAREERFKLPLALWREGMQGIGIITYGHSQKGNVGAGTYRHHQDL